MLRHCGVVQRADPLPGRALHAESRRFSSRTAALWCSELARLPNRAGPSATLHRACLIKPGRDK
jgi:hypothetical protein